MKVLLKPETKNQKINKLRPEIELLFCCTRTHIDNATSERIKTLIQQNINWEYLISIAHEHGVTPLLYWSLKNTCPESIPQIQLNELRQHFQANTYNNLILTQQLLELLRLLETHKIPTLPFKGPILAASVYNNLSLRRISDLDIVVHEQDFEKTVDLLIAQGYYKRIEVRWECHLVRDDGISNIDLHREIVPTHLSCSISENYWWEELETFTLAGTIVPNLSPEAWFFILSLNGNKECWKSLNRICDIAEVIRAYPEMDWAKIMEKSHKLGCKRLVNLTLLLAGNLLDAPIPETIWQQVQSDSIAKSQAQQVSEQLFSESNECISEVHRTLFHIKTRERLQDKIRIFIYLMNYSGWMTLTEKDLNFVQLPKPLFFLYYIIRPFRIFKKYQQTLSKYIPLKK